MKNLKKVLALAVAFVMCFTMFAGALVFTDVVPGGDYSEAITILSDLGVIAGRPDGNFGINDTITRADACCLIARLMTGKTNPPKSDHVQRFTDVPSGAYYEDAVNYCVAYGVTVGTGGGKFSPELNITDGQFIAMLTRAMGYDTAENPLSFPMGNISVAQQMGLLENVDVNYQSDALRGEDAQMLYNALFARYDREARNKNIYQAADDHYEITIAESVFNMGRLSYDSSTRRATSTNEVDFRGSNIRQPVQCEAHTWVIAGVDARQKENTYVAFAIDDDTEKAVDPEIKGNEWAYVTFTYDNDIEPLLGYRVELWGDMSHDAIDKSYSGNRMDVMAIKTIEGQSAYGYHAGMYDGDHNGKITTAVDGKTLIIDKNNVVNLANIMLRSNNWQTIAPDAYAYKLAQVYESPGVCTDSRINLNFQDGDQYTLYDWDNDDEIDFARRETFKYAEVETLSSKRAVLSAADAKSGNWGEYALALDNDNLKVQADGIEEGDVVEISVVSRVYDKDDGEVVTIKLTPVDPESQTLEKINLTKDTYTFNGEELSMADPDLFDVVEEDESYEDMRSKENVGQAFNLWLDRSGYIIKACVADDRARGYLMVLDTYDGTSNLNYNNRRGLAAIDVLFDDNTVGEEVEVVKDLKIDSYSDGRTGYDKDDRTWDQLKVVGNVFKYYMNEDNRITRLEAMTTYQSADYSFDDSKDRIGILDNNGNKNEVNNYTNYSFTDDAVVFAARQANTNKDVEHAIGYIRVIPAEDHGIDDHADHGGDRYYVDPDDVIAVKVEDIPEIDNRPNATQVKGTVVNDQGYYQWTENDVTHPYELLPTLKQDATTGRYTYRTKATDLDVDSNIVLPKGTSTAKNVDYAFRSEPNEPAIGKNTYGYSYTFGNRTGAKTDWGQYSWIDISGKSAKDNQSTELHLIQQDSAGNPLYLTTPRIAYEYSSKTGDNDIQVALLGVDTLDYFNQSSVKLALITDVNYYGKDTYSIDAAIDGKVGEFKTIAADESDIFTGNTVRSYDDMRTYLNLDQLPDPFRGQYNGLYAEVTMNSDGLITKVRAMDYYDDPTATTIWGANNTARIGSFAEGNVYRVIRGVTTQLRTGSKNTLVTFQPNPIAYDTTHLYQLNKSDDHNLYDNLESYFDSDTYFYKIDQRPRAAKDEEVCITLGFSEALAGDLKEATSDVLEVSEFIDTNNDALYFMADFAVRKSDTDQLVAVFAFDDEFKNNNTDKTAVLAAKHVSGSFKDTVNTTAAVGQISEIAVDSSDARLGGNVEFTYTLRDVVNKVDVDIHYGAVEGDTESAIAGRLGAAISEAFKNTGYVERYLAKDSVLTIWWTDAAKDIVLPNDSENGVDFTSKVIRKYVAGTNLSGTDVQDPTITLRLDDYYAYVTAGKDVKLNIVLNGIKVKSTDTVATPITIEYTLENTDEYYTPAEIVNGTTGVNAIDGLVTAIRARFAELGSDAKLEFTTSGGALAFSGFEVFEGINDVEDTFEGKKVVSIVDVAVP